MAERNVEAVLVMNEFNMNYLTGYEGFSDSAPQLALVLENEEDPVLIFREMDIHSARPSAYLDRSRILGYPEACIGSHGRTPWEPIARMIRDYTGTTRIGCELSAKVYSVKAHAALTHALGVGELEDFDGVINRIKLVKSAGEIGYIQQAAAIADRAFEVGIRKIAVGVREADVAAAVTQALIAGTPDHPGGPSTRMTTMPVGHPANAPHLKWGDGCYAWNCQTNFEIAAYRHRYCGPVSRTVYLGDPPDRLKYLHEATLAGFHAAFDAMKPGATCADVDAAFRRTFAPYRIRKESRIGYSLGIDFGDGGASIQEEDFTVLQPDMVFHIIIGIWEEEDGYIFSEAVRLTETGAMSFNTVPRNLFVVGR